MSIKLLIYILFFPIIVVLSQNLQLFPGAVLSKFRKLRGKSFEVPPDIVQHTVVTEDNVRLDVWEKLPLQEVQPQPFLALIFHGNAAPLYNFHLLQMWASELGIKS